MIFPEKITTEEEKLKYVYRAEELLRLEHNEQGAKFRNSEITEQEWLAYVRDFETRNKNILYERNILTESLGHLQDTPESRTASELLKSSAINDTKFDADIDVKKIKPIKVELIEKALLEEVI